MTDVKGKPCIICAAITDPLPTKENNPAVPNSVGEQVTPSHEAFEAGAKVAHCYMREDEGKPTSDTKRFARFKGGLEKQCPSTIVQLSTGCQSSAGQARHGMLPLRPDMAGLSVGSNNFSTQVYENLPDLVDRLAAAIKEIRGRTRGRGVCSVQYPEMKKRRGDPI